MRLFERKQERVRASSVAGRVASRRKTTRRTRRRAASQPPPSPVHPPISDLRVYLYSIKAWNSAAPGSFKPRKFLSSFQYLCYAYFKSFCPQAPAKLIGLVKHIYHSTDYCTPHGLRFDVYTFILQTCTGSRGRIRIVRPSVLPARPTDYEIFCAIKRCSWPARFLFFPRGTRTNDGAPR